MSKQQRASKDEKLSRLMEIVIQMARGWNPAKIVTAYTKQWDLSSSQVYRYIDEARKIQRESSENAFASGEVLDAQLNEMLFHAYQFSDNDLMKSVAQIKLRLYEASQKGGRHVQKHQPSEVLSQLFSAMGLRSEDVSDE